MSRLQRLPSPPPTVETHTYKTSHAYEQDVKRRYAKGWRVENTVAKEGALAHSLFGTSKITVVWIKDPDPREVERVAAYNRRVDEEQASALAARISETEIDTERRREAAEMRKEKMAKTREAAKQAAFTSAVFTAKGSARLVGGIAKRMQERRAKHDDGDRGVI
jgi:hypothetical protein